MTASGNFYLWHLTAGVINKFVNGNYDSQAGNGCPVPSAGHTVKFSVTATTGGDVFVCQDVTSGQSVTVIGNSGDQLRGGAPGIYLSDGSSTFNGPFVANNVASSGGARRFP